MKYLIHSGGSDGADLAWEEEGLKYGVESVAYSFRNHQHKSKFGKILTPDELAEGWEACKVATKTLKRPLDRIEYPYIKNLISRNWYQVKNSDSIFAIGTFANTKRTLVNGGTGWAVQMGIDNNKLVYLFDQKTNEWYVYSPLSKKFLQLYDLPKFTENFAGIGSRAITKDGINAIKQICKFNFTKT